MRKLRGQVPFRANQVDPRISVRFPLTLKGHGVTTIGEAEDLVRVLTAAVRALKLSASYQTEVSLRHFAQLLSPKIKITP